jgi:hypothetical protein
MRTFREFSGNFLGIFWDFVRHLHEDGVEDEHEDDEEKGGNEARENGLQRHRHVPGGIMKGKEE